VAGPPRPPGGGGADDRLADEEPEVWAEADGVRDADVVDGDVGGEVGAEEAAMHAIDDES
jgi:hypothetical protein